MDLIAGCSQPRWWPLAALLSGSVAYFALGRIVSWLRASMLAHPNPRSSHTVPTPQGAGIVVIPTAAAVASLPFGLNLCTSTLALGYAHTLSVLLAILCLTTLGFFDDRRSLSITLRLAVLTLATGVVILTLPADFRLFPFALPIVGERVLLTVAILWFVNLTNFMDGVDLMSATETISITIGVAALAAAGAVPPELGWMAFAMLGAIVAFVPWNAPPARIFLGDAGSLPLGLALALLLLYISASGFLTSAIILPLYYLTDATFTISRRLVRRTRIWEAHRDHFYQRALQQGMPVRRVMLYVGVTNAALVALSTLAAFVQSGYVRLGVLGIAGVLVACTCYLLGRGPRSYSWLDRGTSRGA